MIRPQLALWTLLCSLSAGSLAGATEAPSGPGPWMVRAWFGDEAMIRTVASWSDHLQVERSKGFVRVLVDADHLARLEALGFFVEADAEGTELLRYAERSQEGWEDPDTIPGFPCYRTVEETYAAASALVAAHPTLATLLDVGDSWDKVTPGGPAGYDLEVLRLTNSGTPGPKPVLLVSAAIHAREYTTAEAALRFAEWILGAYGQDPDATWVLDAHEIHILLHTNPDGRKIAETGSQWRKNTDNDDGCGSSYGTDLNRNFDFYWGAWGGSTGGSCDETYRGPSAGSEPETQTLAAYMTSVFPDQRPDDLTTPAPDNATGLFVDLHSYGGDILSAWGQTPQPTCVGSPPLYPPNCAQILRLGRKWGYLSGYDPGVGSLYPVDGSTKDYSYGRLGVPGYTWELGSNFFEACSSFESSVWPAAFAMLRYAMKVPRAPYLLPAGPDALLPSAIPGGALPGDTVTLTATMDDSRYHDPDGAEPVQAIAAARAYVDVPPWGAGATPIALTAVDGLFDASSEAVTGTFDTTGLAFGRHLVYLEGEDSSGARGPVSAAFFWVLDPATAPTLAGVVQETGSGAPLAATVASGPFATASDPGTGAYSLRVPAGTYDLTASAPGYASQTVAGVVAVDTQVTTTDFDLPYLLSRFADDGEHGNLGWTAQTPWALSTEAAQSPTHAWSDSPGGNYGNSVNTALTSPLWDLTGLQNVTLAFAQIYDLETGYDYGHVEISTNGGSSWSEVLSVNGDGHESAWEQVTLALPTLAGSAQAKLRFRLTSDSSEVRNGWHLDDIRLQATSPNLIFADGFDLAGTDRWSGVTP